MLKMAGELRRRQEVRQDLIVPDSRIKAKALDQGPTIVIESGGWDRDTYVSATDWAHQQVALKAGIPKKFYARLIDEAPDLWEETVNRFLPVGKNRLVRLLDDRMIAFLSDRYLTIDNYHAFNVALSTFQIVEREQGARVQVLRGDLTDTRMYIRAIMPEREYSFVRPDGGQEVLHPGIIISNSEVGDGMFTVAPFLYRAVCSNGIIMGKRGSDVGIHRVHRSSRMPEGILSPETRALRAEAMVGEMRDLIKATFATGQAFDAMIQASENAAATPILDVTGTVSAVSDALSLSEEETQALLNHFMKEGDNTAWGLVNGVTRMAQDRDPDRRVELEAGAYDLLTARDLRWAKVVADA